MEYLNEMNKGVANYWNTGIVMIVPITGWQEENIIVKRMRCSSCNTQSEILGQRYSYVNGEKKATNSYCQYCGNVIVEVTEKSEFTQHVPIPDIREDLKALKLSYCSLDEEDDFDEDNDDCQWVILLKRYDSISLDDRGNNTVATFSILEIEEDIKHFKEKYSEFLAKYNAKISFGTASDHREY